MFEEIAKLEMELYKIMSVILQNQVLGTTEKLHKTIKQ